MINNRSFKDAISSGIGFDNELYKNIIGNYTKPEEDKWRELKEFCKRNAIDWHIDWRIRMEPDNVDVLTFYHRPSGLGRTFEVRWDDVPEGYDTTSFVIKELCKDFKLYLHKKEKETMVVKLERGFGISKNSGRYPWGTATKQPEIKDVIFNDPATIILWTDGTKTVVKRGEGDIYDPEKGMAMAICKKFLGSSKSKGNYYETFKKWLPKTEETDWLDSDFMDILRAAIPRAFSIGNAEDDRK